MAANARVIPNVGETFKTAIQAEIDQNPSVQQAKAAKEGIKALTTALPDVIQGIKSAVEKQLNDQKEDIKKIVDNRLAAAGLSVAAATGGGRAGTGRRGKKIAAKGIRKMASRRGTRRSTRRRAGTRKARRGSRKNMRK